MSGNVVIPFNHQPVNTGRDDTSYQAPAGIYSRVVISYSVAAYVTQTSSLIASVSDVSYHSHNDTKSGTIEVWLKPGDEITFVSTPVSSTASIVPAGSGFYLGTASGGSVLEIKINAQEFAEIRAFASANFSGAFSAGGSHQFATFSGSIQHFLYYEEYNEIAA